MFLTLPILFWVGPLTFHYSTYAARGLTTKSYNELFYAAVKQQVRIDYKLSKKTYCKNLITYCYKNP